MRFLVRDGLATRDRRYRFFERAAEQAISTALLAASTVLATVVMLYAAVIVGAFTAASPDAVLEWGGAAILAILVAAAGIWGAYRAGLARRLDEGVNEFIRWVGIDP
ncbi:hypothetical protein [Halorubrum aethiopicum]|uniref:hypothetical protein n=1 Tax=Halorubrum aethiopicum TaxID=1758255 RepID=UPI000ACE67CB|nr:hypothetical protein [Halorubrum aethiopicum]